MNLSKVKDVFGDWVKSGFYFGNSFSNMLFDRLDASAQTKKFGGGTLDVAAGAGLTYLAATSAIGTVVGAAFAVSAIATAPVSAVVTVAMGVVWLALSAMTGGIGLGLLDAARKKAGITPPSSWLHRAKSAAQDFSPSVKSTFKSGKKASADFKNAQSAKPANSNTPEKPAAKSVNDFKL